MAARKATTKAGKKVAEKDAVSLEPASTVNVLERMRGAQQVVAIGKAGGRAMLNWIGKRVPATVQAFPAQWIETYGEEAPDRADWEDWPDGLRCGGLLYHGDNKEVLAHLLANGFRGQVKLIYIDPPFDSGADYVRKVELRGAKGKAKLDGERYTLGEQIQYTDIWANDNYLQFMYERLLLLKELLSVEGSIYLHVDWRRNAQLRLVMDEIFGSHNFLNEIVWHFPNKIQGNVKRFATNHNNLLLYAKDKTKFTFHRLEEERDKPIKVNRRYWDSETGTFATERDDDGNVLYAERKERVVDDVWVIPAVSSDEGSQLDYPTQKPEQLLERVVVASSDPSDLVLDCFIGSGTTGAVAQRLGRRWIGCDINKGAIQTTAKRLQGIMETQAAEGHKPAQGKLLAEGEAPAPAQLGFTHWRVNDYDLAIQHNEAVALACEYLGVEHTRSDRFFEGVLGKRLVKIIPFGHPLSPMDLEAIRDELKTRPEEDRAITVVCLGKELAADAWLENWNRMLKSRDAVNRIDVIELRNDPKYGGLLQHEAAEARVKIKRAKDKLHVTIEDFISPGILNRLAQQSGVVRSKIADWRSMVDSVMIDPAYDGQVFNVQLSDVPERKTDFVSGDYTLDVPDGDTTVAVKITDMLGEDVLVTQTV